MKEMKKYVALCLTLIMMLYISTNNKVQAVSTMSTSPIREYNWNETTGQFILYANNPWMIMSASGSLEIIGNTTGYGDATISFRFTTNATYTFESRVLIYNTNNYNDSLMLLIKRNAITPDQVIVVRNNLAGTYDFKTHNLNLNFNTPGDWHISSSSSFITFSKTSGLGSSSDQSVGINLSKNTSTSSRTATITLSSDDYNCTKEITITQTGAPAFYDIYPTVEVNHCVETNISGTRTVISFTATIPWQLYPDQEGITSSITSGGAGTYSITLDFPRSNGRGHTYAVMIAGVSNVVSFVFHQQA